ncbi:MAG: hypothetical protein EOO53_21555 [Gammaproteobacteria bacterium]|nr:MAG: hypothetical protein EOO53_21555 [Gammaproteobacteria bacterium]
MKDFKEISIRGRYAFGAVCLERALEHYGIANYFFKTIPLSSIWEFTSEQKLDAWDINVRRIDPECYDNEVDVPDENIAAFYRSMHPTILDILSDLIEIGASNLYGGTEGYSPSSLIPLERILKTCAKAKIPLPDISPFAKSSINEERGWGYPRDRSFFIA